LPFKLEVVDSCNTWFDFRVLGIGSMIDRGNSASIGIAEDVTCSGVTMCPGEGELDLEWEGVCIWVTGLFKGTLRSP